MGDKSARGQITELLSRAKAGDSEAASQLAPIICSELRAAAQRFMRRERPNHTLQTTGLINEAYLRLFGQNPVDWSDRAHFYAVASNTMRWILIEYARARRSAKRGGSADAVEFRDDLHAESKEDWDRLLDVDRALERLARIDPRKARIVELRFFVGLGIDEIADFLGLSERTIRRDWDFARTWLFGELGEDYQPSTRSKTASSS